MARLLNNRMETSPRWRINTNELKRVGLGLLIALGGAGLTYLEEQIPTLDFGAWLPMVVALNSGLVNFGRKFLSKHGKLF